MALELWFSSALFQQSHFFSEDVVHSGRDWDHVVYGANACPFDSGQWDSYTMDEVIDKKVKNKIKKIKERYDKDDGPSWLNSMRQCGGCRDGCMCDRCSFEVEDWYEHAIQQINIGDTEGYTQWYMGYPMGCFATWNAAGLFCEDVAKLRAKLRYMGNIIGHRHFVFLGVQETHDDGVMDLEFLDKVSRTTQRLRRFRSTLSAGAGGLLILIAEWICALLGNTECCEPFPGRLMYVKVWGEGRRFVVFNLHLHAETMSEKLVILRKLLDLVRALKDWACFIVGDFNFVTEKEGRIKLGTGETCGTICQAAKFWNDHFTDFQEIVQDNLTRYPGGSWEGKTAARLDRGYFRMGVEAEAYSISRGPPKGVCQRPSCRYLLNPSQIKWWGEIYS